MSAHQNSARKTGRPPAEVRLFLALLVAKLAALETGFNQILAELPICPPLIALGTSSSEQNVT